MSKIPVITDMQVIPVAGYDSMLMTLSGAHAPCCRAPGGPEKIKKVVVKVAVA